MALETRPAFRSKPAARHPYLAFYALRFTGVTKVFDI
jgi:hypothetical protein